MSRQSGILSLAATLRHVVATLLIGIVMLAGASASRAASLESGYVSTGQTGAQTFINVEATSHFYIVPGSSLEIRGARLNMKADNSATAPVTFTLYAQDKTTVLRSKTLSRAEFCTLHVTDCGNWDIVPFNFDTPYTAKPGQVYYATVSSAAAKTSTYFIKISKDCSVTRPNGSTITNAVCTTDVAPTSPSLSMTKTSDPTSVTAGGTVTYNLAVTNTGTAASSNVTVKDQMPSGLTAITPSAGWTCSNSGNLYTCNYNSSLAVGATATLSLTAVATATAATITNWANVGPLGGPANFNPSAANCSVTDVQNGTCASASTSVTGTTTPYLEISLAGPSPTLTPGANSTYTATVANNGGGATTESPIHAYIQIPAGLTYVSSGNSTWSCTPLDNPVTQLDCTASGPLSAGESSNFPIEVTVPANATPGQELPVSGLVGNSGAASGAGFPACGDGFSCAEVTAAVGKAPTFSLTKSQPKPALQVNKQSTYTLTVTTAADAGTVPASVKDQLPVGMSLASYSGNGWTCAVDSTNLVTCDKTVAGGSTETIDLTVAVAPEINNQQVTNYAAVGFDGETPTPGPSCTPGSDVACASATSTVSDVRAEIKRAVEDDVQAYMAARLDQIVGTLDGPSRLQRFRDTACGVSHDMSMSGNATSSDANIAASGSASMKGVIIPTADVPEQQCGRFNVWTEIDVGYVDGLEESSATGGMLTVGAEYLLTDYLLAGVRLGIDYTDASFDSAANSDISGTGWLAGPYFSAELYDSVFLDGFIGYGTSWNDYSGNYDGLGLSGNFETQRLVGNLNLSGSYDAGPVLLTPMLGMAYGREWSDSFDVSNGIVGKTNISSQAAELLRFTGRVEVGYMITEQADEAFEVFAAPKVTFDAVRDGGSEADQLLGDSLWRGGIEGGLRYSGGNFGASLQVGYDGIGVGDWNAYTGQLQLNYTW